MGTNNLAPTGFAFARNYLSGANTYATTQLLIANGYGTNIMKGDPVIFATGTTGFVALAASASPGQFLGFFDGVLPYYDTTQQATAHGLNGAYLSTAAPPTGANVPCTVVTDPFASFVVQTNFAGPFQQSWVGSNCSWLQSSVGQNTAGNGRSVAVIDGGSFANTATLPLRVIGPAGVAGGPQDPANNNPWIEVRMNLASALNPTGL